MSKNYDNLRITLIYYKERICEKKLDQRDQEKLLWKTLNYSFLAKLLVDFELSRGSKAWILTCVFT